MTTKTPAETLNRIRAFGREGIEWQVLGDADHANLAALAAEGLVFERGNRVYAR